MSFFQPAGDSLFLTPRGTQPSTPPFMPTPAPSAASTLPKGVIQRGNQFIVASPEGHEQTFFDPALAEAAASKFLGGGETPAAARSLTSPPLAPFDPRFSTLFPPVSRPNLLIPPETERPLFGPPATAPATATGVIQRGNQFIVASPEGHEQVFFDRAAAETAASKFLTGATAPGTPPTFPGLVTHPLQNFPGLVTQPLPGPRAPVPKRPADSTGGEAGHPGGTIVEKHGRFTLTTPEGYEHVFPTLAEAEARREKEAQRLGKSKDRDRDRERRERNRDD